MTLTCVVFFYLSPVGGKTCYGFATQMLATVYCKMCYEHTQKYPTLCSCIFMFYVILDIVDLKGNYLFAKKCMDSEMRVEQTLCFQS